MNNRTCPARQQLERVFLMIIMYLLVNDAVVSAQTDGGLIALLCETRWFGWLDMICNQNTPPPTLYPMPAPTQIPTNAPNAVPSRTNPRQSPAMNPTRPPIVLLPCDGSIKTSADLQAAFSNATTKSSGPATVIKVCQERIVVPPLFNITTTSRDTFGFQIKYKKIDLQCGRTSSSNLRGLCTLEGTGGAGLFYLNNSTLKVTGFTLSNGGGKDHSAGGAIYQTNYSFVTLVDSIVKDSIAGNGGAINTNNNTQSSARLLVSASSSSGRIELVNTTFIGNKARNGGAIYASNAIINGQNVEFLQNEGSRVGGALAFFGTSTASFNNSSKLINNYAGGYGGAIFTTDKVHAKFYNTQFIRNQALGSIVEILGQSKVELVFSQVKTNRVNETEPTLFGTSNDDLKEFGVLKIASAIRSLSPQGILFQNSLFSGNKVKVNYQTPNFLVAKSSFNTNTSFEPYDTANLFVDGNGTAQCSATTYCAIGDDIGVTCVGSACTNCDQLGSTIVPPGVGDCFDTKLFQSTDELRLAVTTYFSDAKDTVLKQYGDPIGTWRVDYIFDFSYLFCGYDFQVDTYFNKGAQNFNEDISEWNTSSATNTANMFGNSSFNQDISSWDVSKVTDMSGMFGLAKRFNQNVDAWNVSSVTDMSCMFCGALKFNGDLKNWNVSSVTKMPAMFGVAKSFNGNLRDWDVSSVTDMSGMFYSAVVFDRELSAWDVSSVESLFEMFKNAEEFNRNLCPWGDRLPRRADTREMFNNTLSCPTTAQPRLWRPIPGPFCYRCFLDRGN